MKRVIALLVVLALVLCGCSTTQPADDTGVTTTTVTTDTIATEGATAGTTADTAGDTGVTDMNTTTAEKVPGNTTVTSILPNVVTVKPKTTTTTTAKTTVAQTTAAPANAVTLLEPADKYQVEMQAPMIEHYLSITSEKEAAEFWVASYTGMAHSGTFTARWSSKGMLWRFYISEDPTFAGVEGIVTTNQWHTVANLMPGRTYYWKVVNGYGVESEVRSVTTTETMVRWIDAPDSDNIRDLGGWKTESGKTINYELLYRGGCLDGYNGGPILNSEGRKVLKDQLGIRTEIDLRGGDVGMEGSPFGATYVSAAITQYDYIYTSDSTKKSLGTIFEVLSDEANYPILYHCNAGADRTGTLSFLINGLLGVSFEDLTRDFELTGFSSRGKRLRSELLLDTITFDPDGVMQYSGSNHIAWGPLYDIMMKDYRTGSGKLSDAIANFLKTECGVTQDQIDAVRRIMLK